MTDLDGDEADAEAIVRAARDDVAEGFHATDASVTVGGLPPVEADAELLETLFGHLLENALRHGGSDDGPPTVTASGTDRTTVTACGADRDDRVEFRVSDDGPGIPDG